MNDVNLGGFNSDNSRSTYGWFEGRTVVDVGIGNADQTFDISLIDDLVGG